MKPAKDPIAEILNEIRLLRQEVRGGSKRLFTVGETANYLGLAAKTIRNGLGPRAKKPFPVRPVHVGSRILFRREDLDRFCDSLATEKEQE